MKTKNMNLQLFAGENWSCTINGLGSENPNDVTFLHNGTMSTFEEVTLNGDTFIKIPTMYRKVNTISSDQITSFTIATVKIDDDYEPYPVFLDENGRVLPYVLIGKYWNTDVSSMVSTTTGAGKLMNIDTAREYARARGNGYQQWDWMFQRLWQDLIICAKETINTNSGTSWTTDNLGIYWTSLGCWVDGITRVDSTWCVSYKPSKYINSATGSTDGYTSLTYSAPTTGDEIQKLGYDTDNKFANYPSAVVSSSSYNTYYCDYYSYRSGNQPVISYVGYSNVNSGAFVCDTYGNWTTRTCARLCYRPIVEGYSSTIILRDCGCTKSDETGLSGSYSATITADDGYYLSSVTCTDQSAIIEIITNKQRGTVSISNITDDFTIFGTASPLNICHAVLHPNDSGETDYTVDLYPETNSATNLDINRIFETEYRITTTVEYGNSGGDRSIWSGESASVTISPNEGYNLPSTITVNEVTGVSGTTGVTWSYNNSNNITGVVNLTNAVRNVIINAVCERGSWYATISNLGSEDPRDVSFTYSSTFTPSTLGIEEITIDGDIFIKIPKMYRKINLVENNQITSFTIATTKIDNDYEIYPVFLDENGNILDYVLIGKYWNSSSSSMVSTTAGSGVSMTISNARNYARLRGTGYQQWDWMFHKLWQDLIICAKRTIDTNSGVSHSDIDELGIYWGVAPNWVDGIVKDGTTWCICYEPSKYVNNATSSTTGYVSLLYSAPSSSGEIQKLGYDSSKKFANYPSAVTSNSNYNTYYCDDYDYTAGNLPILAHVGAQISYGGAFGCYTGLGWDGTRNVRLCYRPINNN